MVEQIALIENAPGWPVVDLTRSAAVPGPVENGPLFTAIPHDGKARQWEMSWDFASATVKAALDAVHASTRAGATSFALIPPPAPGAPATAGTPILIDPGLENWGATDLAAPWDSDSGASMTVAQASGGGAIWTGTGAGGSIGYVRQPAVLLPGQLYRLDFTISGNSGAAADSLLALKGEAYRVTDDAVDSLAGQAELGTWQIRLVTTDGDGFVYFRALNEAPSDFGALVVGDFGIHSYGGANTSTVTLSNLLLQRAGAVVKFAPGSGGYSRRRTQSGQWSIRARFVESSETHPR